MSSNTIYRMATANQYDNTRQNLLKRQHTLSGLHENITSGKRVIKASDDPVAAAQAERAITRLSRVQTEQRALEAQRNSIAQAETTLGDAIDVMQAIRDEVVSAGRGALTDADRKTIANQIQSLRDQLTEIANRKDTNGVPLLGALGSALTPFLGSLGSSSTYQFNGLAGQAASVGVTVPLTLDGHSAFMFDPQRDGVYAATLTGATGTPSMTTTGITATDLSQVTGDEYAIVFSGVGPGATAGTSTATYTIQNLTQGTSSAPVTVPDFPNDKPLDLTITDVPGLSFSIKASANLKADGSIAYSPANGDTINLKPSASIFNTIDSVVQGLTISGDANAATQAVTQALTNLDKGMERLSNMRGYAGELLNRVDRITSDQENRSIQLESDRSRAEDLDMIKGISDYQNANTAYEAALQSYAQIQRLSLFNYIS